MYLHEAIVKVLRDKNRPMKAADIAHEINIRKLYQQRAGTPVPSSQIGARVRQVNLRDRDSGREETFFKRGGFIGLTEWQTSTSEERESHELAAESRESGAIFDFEGDIAGLSFLNRNGFLAIGTIRDLFREGLPVMSDLDKCGLYAITIPTDYSVDFIGPDEAKEDGNVINPWDTARLRRKWVPDVDVVYFGIAGARSNRSLRKRLRDLLRHGRGETSDRGPHKGGEILWQLMGYGNFTVWVFPTEGPPVPRELEQQLLAKFEQQTGQLPFANRQR